MTKKLKLISWTALIFVLLGFFISWRLTKRDQRIQNAKGPVLASNEKKKVVVDTRRKRVVVRERKPDGTEKIRTTEGVETAIVTLTNSGDLEVMTVNRGFTFKPGIGVGYANEGRAYLDVQVYWWGQYSLLLGTSFGYGDSIRGYGGLGYALPFDQFRNTIFFLGVDNKRDFNAGVSVRF